MSFQLGVFGIIAALLGAVGAWIGGIMDTRIGPKPVINFCIVALILVSALTITTGPGEVLLASGSPAASKMRTGGEKPFRLSPTRTLKASG